jgi:hypothetical protein
VTNLDTGVTRTTVTSESGVFAVQGLPPGDYMVSVEAAGMQSQRITPVRLDLGAETELRFRLSPAGRQESITVAEGPPLVETQSAEISTVIDDRAIADLPLNGRRFSDLALQAPGVTKDPRGLTSASSGDLAFGGAQSDAPAKGKGKGKGKGK